MITLWAILVLSSNVICHEVYETVEEDDSQVYKKNITTLYPIPNKFNNNTVHGSFPAKKLNDTKDDDDKSAHGKIKTAASIWKIDTAYAEPKAEQDNNTTDSKEQPVIEKPDQNSKEFKPSIHLGNFFDDDSFESPVLKQSFGRHFSNNIKKPPSGFKFPLDVKDFKRKPYPDFTKNRWKVAQPVTVKAGDLYKFPDAFKDGQVSEQEHNLAGDLREEHSGHGIQKKMNPWKDLLRLMTAFIPVGLIISALTPSVVTIQNVGNQAPPRLYRRRGAAETGLDYELSEGCRRRLLCEIRHQKLFEHLDKNGKHRLPKNCSNFQCEDPSTLTELVSKILAADSWPITQTTRGDHIT